MEAQKIGELLCVTLKQDTDRCLFDKWTAKSRRVSLTSNDNILISANIFNRFLKMASDFLSSDHLIIRLFIRISDQLPFAPM